MRTGTRSVLVGLGWAGAAAALLVLVFIGYCAVTLPASGGSTADETGPAIVFTAADGQVFAARGAAKGEKVEIDRLPADLVHALIAIEDRRFYSHHGIDLRGILRAAWHDLSGEGGLEGASTITQQLARISYLSPERSLRRKVQEVIIALWLETRLGKDQILARYLNTAYFGAGAYGVDAAAQRYFGKKAGSLNLAESAMLAGLIRSPTQLAPTRNPGAARRRADTVLEAMVAAGYIDKTRAAAARAHPAKLAIPPETEPGQNYFVDTAESELKRLVGSPPIDLGAVTTLDPRLQEAAEGVVENGSVKRAFAGMSARRRSSRSRRTARSSRSSEVGIIPRASSIVRSRHAVRRDRCSRFSSTSPRSMPAIRPTASSSTSPSPSAIGSRRTTRAVISGP